MRKPRSARLPHPVFGWDANLLARNLTAGQLREMGQALEMDPNNWILDGGSVYTPAVRRKLAILAQAVAQQLAAQQTDDYELD